MLAAEPQTPSVRRRSPGTVTHRFALILLRIFVCTHTNIHPCNIRSLRDAADWRADRPARGCPASARTGPLRRRRPRRRNAACGLVSQFVAAWTNSKHRRRGGGRPAGCGRRIHIAGFFRIPEADPVAHRGDAGVRELPATAARRRQGPICRRTDGCGGRDQSLRRRGRRFADFGRDRGTAAGAELGGSRERSHARSTRTPAPIIPASSVGRGDAEAAFRTAPYVRRETLHACSATPPSRWRRAGWSRSGTKANAA